MSESKDSGDGEEFLEVACSEIPNDYTYAPSSPLLKGMDLDLSLASKKGIESKCVQEDTILVNFDLPDGSQGESYFKLGQTVEVLKSFVECEYGIPMQFQIMYIDEKPMMNPLSLLDFEETRDAKEIFIRVEGPMEDHMCKK